MIKRTGSQTAFQPEIHVRNLQRKIPVDIATLQAFAERALRLCLRLKPKDGLHKELPTEIFVLLISGRRMVALHRQFLKATGSTDVITFQHGEVFISVPTARRNAKHFGNSLLTEIELCIVHGLLHLCGFDDRDENQARKMRAMQTKILSAARK